MKTSELIEALYSCPEDEVFIKADDGLLDDFTIEHVDEQFDGFDTVLILATWKGRWNNENPSR